MRRSLTLLLLTLAGLVVVACGTSGRDLTKPIDGAVSPTRSTQVTVAPSSILGVTATPFTLTSTAFDSGAQIPADYSCSGPSPALAWSGVPAGTTELALVVTDDSGDGFVHWLVTGISPTTGAIDAGSVPAGGQQHPNSTGKLGWFGPCPAASSHTSHSYSFALYALTKAPTEAPGAASKTIVADLQAALAAGNGSEAVLTGVFGGDTAGSSPGSLDGTPLGTG
jgi:phosphatidylethanolamine-binding protein (PEBP) family uncharacterized protein